MHTHWQRYRTTLKKAQFRNVLMVFFVIACTSMVFLPQISIHLFGGYPHASAQHAVLVSRTSGTTPIQHIVIMDKENHTFDNLFGTFPGANGATTYTDPNGLIHPLNHTLDHLYNDISHTWQSAELASDGGKMDKFSQIPGAIQNGVDYADSQYLQADIPNYWQYASTFTLSDNFFSVQQGPSYPNHIWTIAGEDGDAANNPGKSNGHWGCDAPNTARVLVVHSNGSQASQFPCFDFKTIGDELDTALLSWRYYAPTPGTNGGIWNIYNTVKHIRYGSDWSTHVFLPSQFDTDVANGTLPSVSWLVEPFSVSEHPPNSECAGENWTVQRINEIMNSPLWASTAIVLMWDDFGGFYDHVPAITGPNSFTQYGFRTPAIMISPYAKAATVDHTFSSTVSIPKFIETTFGLPALTTFDGSANDLNSMLNFNQTPLPPLVLNQRTCPAFNAPYIQANTNDD